MKTKEVMLLGKNYGNTREISEQIANSVVATMQIYKLKGDWIVEVSDIGTHYRVRLIEMPGKKTTKEKV